MLIVAVFSGGSMMQDAAELIVTLPILLVLVWYIAPSVRFFSHYPAVVQHRFGMIPIVYYAFDYLSGTYTNLLADGILPAMEFMSFVCCRGIFNIYGL